MFSVVGLFLRKKAVMHFKATMLWRKFCVLRGIQSVSGRGNPQPALGNFGAGCGELEVLANYSDYAVYGRTPPEE